MWHWCVCTNIFFLFWCVYSDDGIDVCRLSREGGIFMEFVLGMQSKNEKTFYWNYALDRSVVRHGPYQNRQIDKSFESEEERGGGDYFYRKWLHNNSHQQHDCHATCDNCDLIESWTKSVTYGPSSIGQRTCTVCIVYIVLSKQWLPYTTAGHCSQKCLDMVEAHVGGKYSPEKSENENIIEILIICHSY